MRGLRLALAGLVSFAALRAEFPAVVAQALEAMPTQIPTDLGYTVDITRGPTRTTESFDPSRPVPARWRLESRDGRQPSPKEHEEYSQQRAASTELGYRASFAAGQIDRSWAETVTESPTHLTVRLRFSEAAVASDKLLGQVDLIVSVHKTRAAVASYRLLLRAPYTPVLGVRMHTLDSGAEFDDDGRLRRTWSRFEGRIFLRSVNERIEARYRDYVRAEAPDPVP